MPTQATDCSRVVERLSAFIGAWRMEAALPLDPPVVLHGRTVFEAMPGGNFVVQIWEVDRPYAPDGVALIGLDAEQQRYARHVFDSAGADHVYEMTFADGVWTLCRRAPGFVERFTGVFGDRGRTIRGRWEHSVDGEVWEHDFDVTYTKVR